MRAIGLATLFLVACNASPSVDVPAIPAISGEVTIQKVEWGQSVLKPELRLVAGKPTLLRVYLTGDREGLPVGLKGEVFRGTNRLGELHFTGPASLPITINPAELEQTFRATLPTAWVAAGLEVRLLADPSNQIDESNEADNRQTLRPPVGTGTVLPLTLVPVLQPGQTAQPVLPGTELLRDMLPLRDVQTVTRAPFSYGATISNASSDWSSLLSALRSLRTSDGSSRYYYGVVRVGYSSGIAGIGYIGLPVSAGWDFSASAARVMAHEIGHNLGRDHAPCNVAGEPNYPYSGGSIGTWGYSLASAALKNPTQYKDVMSYCTPQWISDYSYAGMQSFLEALPPASESQSLAAPQEVLLIGGRIREGQVLLNPITKMWAIPEPPRPGAYRLRLDASGGLVDISFQTERVEAPHGPGQPPEESGSEEHFSFSLPNPGLVRGLEITSEGRRLFQRAANVRPQGLGAPNVRVSEQNHMLVLSWDSQTYPYATVAHLGGERTTLGLWLMGGEARLSIEGLASRGRLEVALSDGVNTVREEFAR